MMLSVPSFVLLPGLFTSLVVSTLAGQANGLVLTAQATARNEQQFGIETQERKDEAQLHFNAERQVNTMSNWFLMIVAAGRSWRCVYVDETTKPRVPGPKRRSPRTAAQRDVERSALAKDARAHAGVGKWIGSMTAVTPYVGERPETDRHGL